MLYAEKLFKQFLSSILPKSFQDYPVPGTIHVYFNVMISLQTGKSIYDNVEHSTYVPGTYESRRVHTNDDDILINSINLAYVPVPGNCKLR